MSLFAKAQNSVISKFLKLLFRMEVIGVENEPATGNYIITSNHSSNYDPVILGVATTKPIRYMAKAELFKVPVLRSIIKAFGAYPVNRGAADVSSIKTAIKILNDGEILGMYQQGRRSKKRTHPETAALKNGLSMIAHKAEVGVLPVAIITKRHKVGMFRKTIVVIGKFISPDELNFKEGSADYKQTTEYIYSKIIENYKKYYKF